VSMAHWSGIGIPKTNAIALEVSYTHTHCSSLFVESSWLRNLVGKAHNVALLLLAIVTELTVWCVSRCLQADSVACCVVEPSKGWWPSWYFPLLSFVAVADDDDDDDGPVLFKSSNLESANLGAGATNNNRRKKRWRCGKEYIDSILFLRNERVVREMPGDDYFFMVARVWWLVFVGSDWKYQW